MLGLTSAINMNRGYAPAEKTRQRALSNGKTLVAVADISDFTHVQTEGGNGAQAISSEDLRVTGTGYSYITSIVSPGTRYNFAAKVANWEGGGRGQINVGNSANDNTYGSTGTINSSNSFALSFLPTQTTIYFSFFAMIDNKYGNFDNISLKKV